MPSEAYQTCQTEVWITPLVKYDAYYSLIVRYLEINSNTVLTRIWDKVVASVCRGASRTSAIMVVASDGFNKESFLKYYNVGSDKQ